MVARRRLLPFVVSVVLVTSVLSWVGQAAPASAEGRSKGPFAKSTPVGSVKPRLRAVSSQTAKNADLSFAQSLPAGGSGSVAVSGTTVAVGGIGVRLSPVDRDTAPDGSVSVQVATPDVVEAAQVNGAVLALQLPEQAPATSLLVGVDYASFVNLFGGDYGNRLRLVELPGCVLTTPDVPSCQVRTPLASTNAGGMVSAEVAMPAGPSTTSAVHPGRGAAIRNTGATPSGVGGGWLVLAATPGVSSNGENFAATSLSEAYSWSAGNQGGTFTTSYDLPVPKGLGGPEPDLAVQYDSGGVDGQTLSQNGQTSWAGEGWDLQTGYIEESFRSCGLDGGTTPDLCQFSPYNATMVFQGSSVRLVRDASTGVWHASSDAALKVEQLTGTGSSNAPGTNGTHNNEYWRVTTQDGTAYYFGINHRYSGDTAQTLSTQTEPVFGNNSGELCHGSTFGTSWCQVGYRWNLDYVVDTSGNSMTYVYTQLTGHVGIDNNNAVEPYVITDTLNHIDYGTRAGSEASTSAPARVEFGDAYRCTGSCVWGTSDFPDTPWDQYCSSTTSCPGVLTPTYFTEYELSTVTTEIWQSGTNELPPWDRTPGFYAARAWS